MLLPLQDKKVVNTVADTFRPNPKIDTKAAITELGIGEALVSVLDAKGSPTPVERILIRPLESRLGPLKAAERQALRERSPIKGRYLDIIDRESAYELLRQRAEQKLESAANQKQGSKAKAPTTKTTRPRSNR